jgi:DNA-directed RNA polymerase specialized sigma24 family protein
VTAAANQRTDRVAAIDGHLTRVRRALVARYGTDVGNDVAADVTSWAWEHLDEVVAAANPAGLLFRVGQSKARPYHRWLRRRSRLELLPEGRVAEHDPALVDLFRALGQLTEPQRIAVVLVHAHGERYDDVARLLGVSTAAVTNHVHRGLHRLRSLLEDDA